MTLKEFYAAVGGDYDATLNRIPKESMVLRFVKKYADDKTYAQLTEAVKAQDWETAFRASNTLKGVAQNLGFDGLYRAAFALTEEMRGGKPLTDTALYEAVAQQQQPGVAPYDGLERCPVGDVERVFGASDVAPVGHGLVLA